MIERKPSKKNDITRRKFVAGLGSPLLINVTNKSGSQKPVIGTATHRYEVTHDWGELPVSIKYGNTHGVCVDRAGHVYVHHTVNAASDSHDSMVVFDNKGKFVKSWGREFKGGAHGLHISREGQTEFLYLCDTKRALIVKTTLAGEEVFTIGYPKESDKYKLGADGKPATKYSPTNLVVAPNGDIYVGDGYGSSYINQYNKRGEYIRTFGGAGKEPGQLSCPHGLMIDTRNKQQPVLIVADRTNNRLQRFALDGKHIDFVSGVNLPCHFDVWKNGDVVIPDLGARVTLLDRNNKVITHLGEDTSNTWKTLRKEPREKFVPGKFICPHGACFDRNGNILVVEWVEVGRVSMLRKV